MKRRSIVLVLLAALAWLAAPIAATAQPCTTDLQCAPYAGGINQCLGDTLIQLRSICVAGSCQTTETGRLNCNPTGGVGTCVGNTFVQSGARCDALAGRCAQGGNTRITCVKSCSCRGNTLVVSTGICSPGAGCGRAVFRCRKGCTCDPEARCLEDPPSSPRGEPGNRPRGGRG